MRTLDEIIDELPPDSQKIVRRRAKELIEQERARQRRQRIDKPMSITEAVRLEDLADRLETEGEVGVNDAKLIAEVLREKAQALRDGPIIRKIDHDGGGK
jgi:hypothetical protein